MHGEGPHRRRTTLESYGGVKVRTSLVKPCDAGELGEVLRGNDLPCVTFRDGGHAFDTQSLNDTLVVSLADLRRIDVDEAKATVTAGAGATWGDILRETSKRGLVPHVMVTTSHACAAGTLSSDSLSRFSPTLGREGHHVERFSLVPMRAPFEPLECSRTQNPELFGTAIGGLGYVGAVVDVTHRLLRVPTRPGEIIAVATTFEKVQGLEQIAARLLSHVRLHAHKGKWRSTSEALTKAAQAPLDEACAVSVAVNMMWKETGLVATSRYVSVPPSALHRSVFHSPSSFGSWALQIAALFPVLRTIGYWFVFEWGYKKPEKYVDELAGYTFFEDSNRNLRYLLRFLGFPMGIRQQTYIVPFDPDALEASERNLAEFLREAKTLFDERKLSPTLLDVLYMPDEGADSFALSSSRRLPGYAVTFTFEKLWSTRFAREEAALSELAVRCDERGGRVHLVKNVCAPDGLVAGQYAEGVTRMDDVRRKTGARDRLYNGFLRRVLPRLAP
ncbi:MAG TPA: FAD-binding protein [Polyangiaceae bacterium]